MARFIAMYTTPTDPDAFDRHYHEVHVPLANQLPGLRRYTLSKGLRVVRGQSPYYLVAELEWDDIDALQAAFRSPPGQGHRRRRREPHLLCRNHQHDLRTRRCWPLSVVAGRQVHHRLSPGRSAGQRAGGGHGGAERAR